MFTDPHWLLLLLPAAWLLYIMKMPGRKLLLIRVVMILLVICALAGARIKLPGRDGMIIVVADRSLSMPSNSNARVKEILQLLKEQMPANARLGLVSFGARASVEMSPARSSFSGFSAELNSEASNLSEGIDKALSLVPTETSGRIIVISDGQWTGSDPRQSAFKASRRGIPIDFRFVGRNAIKDLAVTRFELPGLLNPGESFVISAEVFSPIKQKVSIALNCSGLSVSSFEKTLRVGYNTIVFRHVAPNSSVVKYQIRVESKEPDPVPENNVAVAIAEIEGKKPVLVISNTSSTFLTSILEKSGQNYQLITPAKMRWNIESLSGFSAVMIENISANAITMQGMSVLSAWVQHMGGGLLITGGKNSYGTGGFYQSPLENILPLSLELRSEHRKLSLALMVVLDRSGSMAAPARGDRTKMDLANIAAASSLDLLSPMDEFGLLAVDSKAHVIVPLQELKEKAKWRDKILRINSEGGGIFVYEGLSKAALMLNEAKARTRHIILFADASDAEQPGTYWELLDKVTKTGMTVSVIGLGTEEDSDANLLKKIAKYGNGRIFFTRDPEELPRLFTQDTFVAARSTFIDDKTTISSTVFMRSVLDEDLQFSSSVGGYNLCYLKPGASTVVQTTDENNAPLLSHWQSGLGRVACYTGATSGEFAGSFITQKEAANLFAGVCSLVAADQRQFIENMPITQKIVRGRWKATLHLDPERERELFKENPEAIVLKSVKNHPPEKVVLKMNWETADTLSASLPLSGNEAIVALIDAGEGRRIKLYPICLPYSQEYSLLEANEGAGKLKEISMISAGRELIDLSGAWESMPATVQYQSVSEALLYLALILFILEVAERRTSLLTLVLESMKRSGLARNKLTKAFESGNKMGSTEKVVPVSSIDKPKRLDKADEVAVSEKDVPANGFSSALKRAKNLADKRNKK